MGYQSLYRMVVKTLKPRKDEKVNNIYDIVFNNDIFDPSAKVRQ